MTVDSLAVVFYTAIFVIPGFIVNRIIESTNPPRKHHDGVFFLRCLSYSIINCAVWSWLYHIIIKSSSISSTFRLVLFVAVSLFGASLIGIAIGIFRQNNLLEKLLSAMKIGTVHHTPAAWDYLFSKRKTAFVIITMVDDSKLFGWYGYSSFTSSDPEERDIYVEKAYQVEGNQWIPSKDDGGFYIPKDQIKCIELKTGGIEENAGNEKEY